MECPHCENVCPDDARTCTLCGTELATVTPEAAPTATAETASAMPDEMQAIPAFTQTPATRKPGSRWLRVSLGTAICLVLLCAVAYAVINKFFPPAAPLTSLIPEDCPVVCTLDSAWCWEAMAGVRSKPAVQQSLAKLESQLGISLEHDVMSWSGETGFALLDIEKGGMPSMLVFLQIRDRKAFLAHYSQLKQAWETKSKLTWTDATYQSVDLHQTTIRNDDGKLMKLTVGYYGGWLVAGCGEKTVERSIDTWRGDTPSIRKNDDWEKVLAKLPEKRCAFFGMNGKAYGQMMLKNTPGMDKMISFDDMLGYISAATVTEQQNTIRLEGYSLATSDKTRKYWKGFKECCKPVQGSALQQLPQGTIVAATFSNPGKVWGQVKDMLLGSFTNPLFTASMNKGLAEIRPLEKVLDNCTGECALALVNRKGLDVNFMAIADTGSPSTAMMTADQLREALIGKKMIVAKDGQLYKIALSAKAKAKPNGFRWGAKDAWFTLATTPDLLAASAKPAGLTLPDGAQGADVAFVANLSFLKAVYDKMEHESLAERAPLRTLRNMHLEDLQFSSYGSLEADGSAGHSVCTFTNWDWRNALALVPELVEQVSQMEKKQKRSKPEAKPTVMPMI